MTSAVRTLGIVRAGVGSLWLAGFVADKAVCGARLPRAGRVAAVVLAARDLTQGGLLAARPRRTSVEVFAGIDVLHALSMLPVVAFAPRYRKAALISAIVAAGWAGAAGAVLRSRANAFG